MAAKRADPATQLAVDTAILSYLLHTSTHTLLRDAPTSRSEPLPLASARKLELPLQMVDSFLTLFRASHPSTAHPLSLALRLRLLRFTALFTLRHHPCTSTPSPTALATLRRTHVARAAAFLERRDPISGYDVAAYERTEVGSERPAGASEQPVPQLLLLDTLPLFIDLVAQAADVYGEAATQGWRALAGRYMAAAAVEAYLVSGVEGPGALREAFAWGAEGSAEGEEGMWEGWEGERAEVVRTLIPPEGVEVREWLREVERERDSVKGVEAEVRGFLRGLLSAGEVPELVRVERG
ncbi:hypothetical protein MMC26_005106 [Xylographa opegraphella]|nr:hypothetical protein [Xylographa opegraphella]